MIRDNVEFVTSKLNGQTIVAATKYASVDKMKELYACGITNFGENRVDSFLEKQEAFFGYDITWHFIGHLQRNKCKQIISKIDCLHSLDSLDLARMIQNNREKPLDCFIQVNISEDENKSGIDCSSLGAFLQELKNFDKINVIGLMTILRQGLSKTENLAYFKDLLKLKEKYNLMYTSMGMSSDYIEAVEASTDFVRLGSVLLGE